MIRAVWSLRLGKGEIMNGQSKRTKRPLAARWLATATALAAVFAALLVGAGTASAATYGGQCGGGYGVIDQHNITGGTIFLTYNNSSGNNCVVTIRNSAGSNHMDALIGLSGDPNWEDTDPGNWSKWAGPVYVYARGHCVDWGGIIGSASWYQFNSHCS
jgi:hypothetical protein